MTRPSNPDPVGWIFDLVLNRVGTFLRRFLPDKIVSGFTVVCASIFIVFLLYVYNYTTIQSFFGH